MRGHEGCRWCAGTGWVDTARDRNEVARCPGPDAFETEAQVIRHRAQSAWDRYAAREASDRTVPPPSWRERE